MRDYPFLRLFERYGTWLSLAVSLAFLCLALLVIRQFVPDLIGATLAFLGAVVLWLFLQTLTEIIRLLSETLIPRP